MADKNIQKIVINQESIPQIESSGKYVFRYRVKNKNDFVFSDWSKEYSIPLTNSLSSLVEDNPIKYSLTQLGTGQEVQSTSGKVALSWSMPDSIKINRFDVYVKWYDGTSQPSTETQNATSWTRYFKVIEGPYIDIKIPEGYDWVQIAVTAAGFPKFSGTSIDEESLFLFKTALTRIPIPLDSGDLGFTI
jgi:hypothetical protein